MVSVCVCVCVSVCVCVYVCACVYLLRERVLEAIYIAISSMSTVQNE